MRLVLIGTFSLALAAPAIAAQSQAPAGVLRGVVYDSLITRRPLEDAEVWIERTNRMARTDAAGRFTFDSLAPGRYGLTFYHPILDSAGISLPPFRVDIDSGGTTDVAIATPSPVRAHHLLCPRDPLQRSGVILGVVRNAVDDRLLPAVIISAHWTTYEIGETRVRAAPRVIEARSDATGHVLLCGLPTDVALVIRGQTEGGSAGMVVVDLAGRAFARADLHLAVAAETGTVNGVVRNRHGSLVPSATVTAVGTAITTQADEFGRFSLAGVAVGSGIVEARAVGYMTGRAQTTVRPGVDQQTEIVLGDSATMLDPVTVEAEYKPYLALVGFEQRRRNSTGHFLDTTDVQRSGATRFEEIFRMVPGIKVRPNGTGYMVEVGRGEGQILNPSAANYCPPAYFVDGVYFPLPPLQTATMPIIPAEVLAIEVYSNLISAPPQYQRRQSTCGVILVWTKRGVPKHRASH
jgi:hypothetical protein